MRKAPVDAKSALALAKKASDIYSTKGKKVLHHNAKADGAVTSDIVESLMLGRSGTLRAPVIVSGKQIVVGFNAELYADILGL